MWLSKDVSIRAISFARSCVVPAKNSLRGIFARTHESRPRAAFLWLEAATYRQVLGRARVVLGMFPGIRRFRRDIILGPNRIFGLTRTRRG